MLCRVLFPVAGVYTSVVFTAVQRRREFGIRSAPGASPWRLIAGAFRQVLRPAGAGVAIGGLAWNSDVPRLSPEFPDNPPAVFTAPVTGESGGITGHSKSDKRTPHSAVAPRLECWGCPSQLYLIAKLFGIYYKYGIRVGCRKGSPQLPQTRNRFSAGDYGLRRPVRLDRSRSQALHNGGNPGVVDRRIRRRGARGGVHNAIRRKNLPHYQHAASQPA